MAYLNGKEVVLAGLKGEAGSKIYIGSASTAEEVTADLTGRNIVPHEDDVYLQKNGENQFWQYKNEVWVYQGSLSNGGSGSGANLVDLGTLTPQSETTFIGTPTAEQFAALATPNTVVKVTLPDNMGVGYGLINYDVYNSNIQSQQYYTTAITVNTPTATTFITLEISETMIIATARNYPVIPVPTPSDAGKVLIVNANGTGYELSDVIGNIDTQLTKILGV